MVHAGHVRLVCLAAHCGRLIVGVDSDQLVRARKGPGRPVQTCDDRVAIMRALVGPLGGEVHVKLCDGLEFVQKHNAHIWAFGDDFQPAAYELSWLREHGVAMLVLPRSWHSTTAVLGSAENTCHNA